MVDLRISNLGPKRHLSPLALSTVTGDGIADYTDDAAMLPLDPLAPVPGLGFEVAGPREEIFFDGPKVHAGIVTCGGLCPGLNNVIRALTHCLWYRYGVRRITGFRYGFAGLMPDADVAPMPLTPDAVRSIHHLGGSILGSSRGPRDPASMVNALHEAEIDILFCLGGDGTMRGANAIAKAARSHERPLSVIGLPKTIDNDLPFVERTFGFETAVSVAAEALRAARVEASGAQRCVGLVKLMGRHAGFVAASAALAAREADIVLVPEQPFTSEELVARVRERLDQFGEAVVVVAEGAGQDLLETNGKRDASGNIKFVDIGRYIEGLLKGAFARETFNLKYIDPSYLVRAAPARSTDAMFCAQLAEHAVHAAMSGKTAMLVGLWCNRFTHVPLDVVTSTEKRIDLDGPLWRSVMDATKIVEHVHGKEPFGSESA